MKNLLLVICLAALAACATTGQKSGSLSTAPMSVSISGSAVSGAANRVVASATAMVGQPYRWGGAAPGGFDCSGLVVYAMGTAGFPMPRTAEQQLHAGVRITRRELQAGDLVFMHLTRKELHVGIAVDGERFVHAPSSGHRVRIDSLNAPPYASGFIEARRVVDDISAH